MNSVLSSSVVPTNSAFTPGAVVLCIRRGDLSVLLPRSWVRGMRELPAGAVTPLPRTNRWVLGLVVEDSRPLPLLDPAVCVAATASPPAASVLLAAPGRGPFALIGADGPGRFLAIPEAAHLEEDAGWIRRVQGGLKAAWWLDAELLAADLVG